MAYKPLAGKSGLFDYYLASVELFIGLLELFSKPRHRFIFNRYSLTASAVYLAGGNL
jgi:hypothetical protein